MMDNDDDDDDEMRSTKDLGEGNDDEDAMEVDESATTHLFNRSEEPEKNHGNWAMPAPALSLTGGFEWYGLSEPNEAEEDLSDSEDESDRDDESRKKKRKKRKAIEEDLTAVFHTKTPESNADFERILLGSPNSSYVWIQYMSFQLQISEIDKAREIGRRAFKTINFREEQERLNVWIALLNLENVYGTDDSLDVTFKEAARANDSKTIHLRLASILEQSGKHDKAIEQYRKTCKKFGASSKVWSSFAEFYLKVGHLEEARKLLPRSFQSLEKRKRRSFFFLSYSRASRWVNSRIGNSQISRRRPNLPSSSISMVTLNGAEPSSKVLWILIPNVGTSGQYISIWKLARRASRLSGISSFIVFKIRTYPF